MIRHLYIHVPFCHRICPYCNFYKHKPGATDQTAFVSALLAELDFRQHTLGIPIIPETIYLGGGTPSLLSEKHLASLLSGLTSRLDLSHLKEWSLEANPATFGISKARLMKEHGITRVSLGIQSFTPLVLQTLGRDHSPKEATAAYNHLREADISSVSIDLMFSIPGQSLKSWSETLIAATSLEPDHLSAYNLTYEEDTAFFQQLKSGTFSADGDRDADHYHHASRHLTKLGYDHYEISNYAKPQHRSRHNQAYWKGADYLGLGPGAVSTVRPHRWTNIPDTNSYIHRQNPTHETETLTPTDFTLERIALLLRTSEGLPLKHLSKTPDIPSELATISKTHIILTETGRPLADEIAVAIA